MGLDIRWPIGLMFSIIGAILVVFGAITARDQAMYERSLDININLVWGALLLVFGLFMLISAKVAAKAQNKEIKMTTGEEK